MNFTHTVVLLLYGSIAKRWFKLFSCISRGFWYMCNVFWTLFSINHQLNGIVIENSVWNYIQMKFFLIRISEQYSDMSSVIIDDFFQHIHLIRHLVEYTHSRRVILWLASARTIYLHKFLASLFPKMTFYFKLNVQTTTMPIPFTSP